MTMSRYEANLKIMAKLEDYLRANPDMRLGQALQALGIIQLESSLSPGRPGPWANGFSEEPTVTLRRVEERLREMKSP